MNPIHVRNMFVSRETFLSCKGLLRTRYAHLSDLILSDINCLDSERLLPPLRHPQLTRLKVKNSILFTEKRSVVHFVNANNHITEFAFVNGYRWKHLVFTGWTSFPNITHLTLNTELDDNPALAQLARHCPSIQVLTIAPYSGQLYPTLAKLLRKFCRPSKPSSAPAHRRYWRTTTPCPTTIV